jgi:hypothetical protein
MADYVMQVTNPVPVANITPAQQNTPLGQSFESNQRIKEADMSLAQVAMMRVGTMDTPSAPTSILASAQTTGGSGGGTFTAILKADATSNGTPGMVSPNQVVNAFSTAFAFNPNFYAKVPTIAADATSYRTYMLNFSAMKLWMAYQNMRTNEYNSALLAALFAGQVRDHYNPILTNLKAQVTNNQSASQ